MVDPQQPSVTAWPAIGAVVADRYRLLARIGEGGMASVFLAERIDDALRVALKILRPELTVDPEDVRRFLQEARAASLIRHPNIVGVLDYGFTGDGIAFLAMEHLVGDDLATVIERDGPLPWERLAPLLLDVCAALESAHRQGIVHRDVKPENCFLTRALDGRTAIKVLDFGIAKDLGGQLPDRPQTATGMLCGSPEYIAPEVIMGKVADARSDIYALGITTYELLSGRHPFAGAELGAMLAAHVERTPAALASLGVATSPAVEDIVQRCLAKDPEARFPDMRAVATAIEASLSPDAFPHPTSPSSPHTLVSAMALGLILVFVGLGWWLLDGHSPESEPEAPTAAAADLGAPEPEPEPAPKADLGAPATSAAVEATEAEGEAEPPSGDAERPRAGVLNDASARRLIKRKIEPRARECLREHATLVKGQRFPVSVEIDAAGKAKATAKVLARSEAARCIDELFRRQTFPKSKSGLTLDYEFTP